MNDYILFKDINGDYQTLPELLKPVETEEKQETEENTETENKEDPMAAYNNRSTIYYVTDLVQQGQYVNMFKENNMNAVVLSHNIDTSFISQLEQRNENYKFMRIDADLTDALKDEATEDLEEATTTLSDIFKDALKNDKLTVKVEKLKMMNLLL